jgi:hypothetical protein
MTFLRALNPQRMQSQRISESKLVCDLRRLREVIDMSRRDHDHGHTGGTRPFDDRVAVRIELVCVKVAMRIDPHAD